MKTTEVFRLDLAGFDIVLQQENGNAFTVIYGRQIRQHLSYSAACRELGEAIFHALCCEHRIKS